MKHWTFHRKSELYNFVRTRQQWLKNNPKMASAMANIWVETQYKYTDGCYHTESMEDAGFTSFLGYEGDDYYPYFALMYRKFWNRLKQDALKMCRTGRRAEFYSRYNRTYRKREHEEAKKRR